LQSVVFNHGPPNSNVNGALANENLAFSEAGTPFWKRSAGSMMDGSTSSKPASNATRKKSDEAFESSLYEIPVEDSVEKERRGFPIVSL